MYSLIVDCTQILDSKATLSIQYYILVKSIFLTPQWEACTQAAFVHHHCVTWTAAVFYSAILCCSQWIPRRTHCRGALVDVGRWVNLSGWLVKWGLPCTRDSRAFFSQFGLVLFDLLQGHCCSRHILFFSHFLSKCTEGGECAFLLPFLSLLSHCSSPTIVWIQVWGNMPLLLLCWPISKSLQFLDLLILGLGTLHHPLLRSVVFTVFFLCCERIRSCCLTLFCHLTTLHMCF